MPLILPSDPIALQKDLDALAARVAALEGAKPGGPSPDGSVVTQPGPALVDNYGAKWTLVADTVRPPNRIAHNGTVDPVTGNVSKLGIYSGGQLYQWATGGVWVADGNGAWAQTTDPTAPGPKPGSLYSVSNGQFYTPAGQPFRARGVNVAYRRLWGDNQVDLGRVSLAALQRAYPKGLNFVRWACHGENPLPPTSDPVAMGWVNALTAAGIVVLVDLHYTGNTVAANDQRSNAWLADWAGACKGNANVWFDTQNEPHGAGTAISAMMRGQYQAIRGAGNNSPVLLCTGNPGGEITSMSPADFADMHNVGFDTHCYGWMTDQWGSVVSSLGAFRSADGQMPIICAEFGDGGGSNAQDGNWQQNVQTALANPGGYAAWLINWQADAADCLWAAPFDGSAINPGFGQMVHDAIVAGG